MRRTIAIIGGGIAGISCLESLVQSYNPNDPSYDRIVLIAESRIIKKVVDYETRGRNLEKFNVVEKDISDALDVEVPEGLSFQTVTGTVKLINYKEKILVIQSNSTTSTISFDILCLCHGSHPKRLEVDPTWHNLDDISSRLIMIRDTTSVEDFKNKLELCHRLVIVGNGGIGLELISRVSKCDKTWIVRDESIGFPFLDSAAAKFLLDSIGKRHDLNQLDKHSHGSQSFACNIDEKTDRTEPGPSLGPNWLADRQLTGACESNHLEILYQDEIERISFAGTSEHNLTVLTKKGKKVGCDFVAVAIGVEPNKIEITGGQLEFNKTDGGIIIDEQMRTSLPDLYAAGDVVSCENWPRKELWFQMRLWTQARQMGFYTGKCIVAHLLEQDPSIYGNFDCFTHCTMFFNYRLVLLGQYNGQYINENNSHRYEVIATVNTLQSYVKILLKDGIIVGSVLLGESGLEETIENLIHNQIDVSPYKNQLLDGSVDIEDYFD